MSITGRSGVFTPLENNADTCDSSDRQQHDAIEIPLLNFNMRRILAIHNELMTRDAPRIVRVSTTEEFEPE